MATLDDSIRQAIQAHLARSQLSERKLGAFAVGDPSLVPRLKAGGTMRLDTADQLLRYMNEAPIGPTFRTEVEAFLSETGIGERKFGSAAVRDPLVRDEAPERGVAAAFHHRAGAGMDARQQGRTPPCRRRAGTGRVQGVLGRFLHGTGCAGHASRRNGEAALPERERNRGNHSRPGRTEKVPFGARGRGPAHDLAPHAPSPSGSRSWASVPPVRVSHRVRAR